MSELATQIALADPALPLHDAIVSSSRKLDRPEENFARIAVRESFPIIDWGRDFEVRVLLDANSNFSTKKLEASLPIRFQGQRSWWSSYIGNLSRIFCESFHASGCLVRFSQTSTDLCKLFHCDNVHVRLIQTFQGPGTEFLLNDNAKRSGLGQGCNDHIVVDSAKIQRAAEKEILLMRGDRWLPGHALVHRSPPVEESGRKRLYLCLDTIWALD